MSAFRPITNHNLHNYPKIHVDRGSVIKPCDSDQIASDFFIDKNKSSWRKVFHSVWQEGIPFVLRWMSNIKVPENSRTYYIYLTQVLKYIAFLLLHIHSIYIYIYGYFFPYSLMPLDKVCDEFSRCPKWSEAVIRSFAWHPNHDRCALAICNDYIHVYQGANRIRVLRHAQQRKITDMAWQPSNKEVLAVATQNLIILWRIGDNYNSCQLNIIRDPARSSAYLAPGLQLILRAKESPLTANGSTAKHVNLSTATNCDTNLNTQANSCKEFKILENILPAPIISFEFDQSGNKLYACSPNSSKIAILDIDRLFNKDSTVHSNDTTQPGPIEYLTRYRHGITRLLWSPTKNRLVTTTTSSLMRVFEPFKWSFKKWSLQGELVQDLVWSKPHGRILLIANKSEPILYALPFLDNPQAGDVGGNKSPIKALDLTATETDSGDLVGGAIQSLAWDKNGKRLAISFKDNPESILLYKTIERSTVEFHQLGVIKNENCCSPLLMQFHDNFKSGSLLTVCWSDGTCQHIPLFHAPNEQTRNGTLNNDDSFNRTLNRTLNNSSFGNSFQEATSPSRAPRSLTNFCHVSGNNSISSFKSSLMPITQVQHQTTLFSLSARSPVEDSEDANDLTEN